MLKRLLNYQIIYYPDPETDTFPTEKGIALVKADAYTKNEKILYQVVIGNDSVIFDPDTQKIGILPKIYSVGFEH